MSLPPQFLDELRARVALSDLIGKRMRLVRSNREWKGLCPFHNEKSPSFTVNDQKGFFHCFGCGAHGDAIGFLMQHDRLGFMEAVEQLAGLVGLEVPQATPEDRQRYEKRKSLYDLTEAAGRFFESQLAAPPGRAARDYFTRRGLDGETIARFRLGYAPADAQALLAHLKAEGFEEADILEVGLARRPDDGRAPYAFFRNRVIFPVADGRGRVVAFGARLLEGEGPKYVNSPDGPLFHKGQLLYGLSRARQAAGQGHAVVVAEGYMDVIALVRAGFEAAVAPLGTALTEAQIQELWKLSSEPVLCFDGDEAGKRAAWRATSRTLPLLRPGFSVNIGFLPEGHDPDSLIRSHGREAIDSILNEKISLVDFVWKDFLSKKTTDTPEQRAGLRAELFGLADQIGDQQVKKLYRSEFSDRIYHLWFGKKNSKSNKTDVNYISSRSPKTVMPKKEEIIVSIIVFHPEISDDYVENINSIYFKNSMLEGIANTAVKIISNNKDILTEDLQSMIVDIDSDYGKLMRRLSGIIVQHVHRAGNIHHKEKTNRIFNDAVNSCRIQRIDEDINALKESAEDNFEEKWAKISFYENEKRRLRTMIGSLDDRPQH